MDCPDSKSLAAIIAHSEVDPQVAEHVRQCSACQQRLAGVAHLLEAAADQEAFFNQPAGESDDALNERIMKRITESDDVNLPGRPQAVTIAKRSWAGLAMAGCITVAVLIGLAVWFWMANNRGNGTGQDRDIVYKEDPEFHIRFRQTSNLGAGREVSQADDGAYQVSRSYEVVLGDLDRGCGAVVTLPSPQPVTPTAGRSLRVADLDRDQQGRRFFGPFDPPSVPQTLIVFVFEKPTSTETLRSIAQKFAGDDVDTFVDAALAALQRDSNSFVFYRRLDIRPVKEARPPRTGEYHRGLSPQQQRQLRDRGVDKLIAEVKTLRANGQPRDALGIGRKLLELQREVLGDDHPQLTQTYRILADLHGDLGQLSEAQTALASERAIVERHLGNSDWRITEIEVVEAELLALSRLPEAQLQLVQNARRLIRKREMQLPLEDVTAALELVRDIFGEDSRDYATGLLYRSARQMINGNFPPAEKDLQSAIEIMARLFGTENPGYTTNRQNLVFLYDYWGEFAENTGQLEDALEIRRKGLALREILQGKEHWQVASSRLVVSHLQQLVGLDDAKHAEYKRARSLLGSAQRLVRDDASSIKAAIDKVAQCAELIEASLGRNSEYYCGSLYYLGSYQLQIRDYDAAEKNFIRATAILSELVGPRHPDVARYLDRLATLYEAQARYAEAEAIFIESLDIQREVADSEPFGPPAEVTRVSRGYAVALANLGQFYYRIGKLAEAEPLLREAADRLKDGDPYTLSGALTNLGALLVDTGDFVNAEQVLRQAAQQIESSPGDNRVAYALCLNGMGLALESQGRYEEAEATLQKALPLLEQLLPAAISQYGATANSLAIAQIQLGKTEEAELLLRTALGELEQSKVGLGIPIRAVLLRHLATVVADAKQSADYARQSLQVLGKTLGPQHNFYATAQCLAALSMEGDEAKAMLIEGVEKFRQNLDLVAASQSERQQLNMALSHRRALDMLLSHAKRMGIEAAETYEQALAWKGAVLVRNFSQSLDRQQDDDELRPLASELKIVVDRLAKLHYAPIPAESEQLNELNSRKETLERELRRKNQDIDRIFVRMRATPQEIVESLPDDAVLVDFYEYEGSQLKRDERFEKSDRFVTAFVLRAGQPIRRIDFGPAAAIDEAVESWRRVFGTSEAASAAEMDRVSRDLRSLIWLPLEQYVAGMRTVLISPDGATARIPFAALPSDRGSYLIEDYLLASIPTPHVLSDFLTERDPPSMPSMLLVGDVDYDGSTGGVRMRQLSAVSKVRAGLRDLGRLPGTGEEIGSIARSFRAARPDGTTSSLRGILATETAFKNEARGKQFIHVATHGFFAPPEILSAFSHNLNNVELRFDPQTSIGFHPDLLSGLAFAGAKRRGILGRVGSSGTDDGDDGVLTAMEVSFLDLQGCDLVVLSACETGLGQVAGGEGVLGLQRAFHGAGARTVLTSLWVVDTEVTRKLMQSFYRNLWEQRMTKLEALRRAQLDILRERDPSLQDTAKPYYWAGWVLSGDPF